MNEASTIEGKKTSIIATKQRRAQKSQHIKNHKDVPSTSNFTDEINEAKCMLQMDTHGNVAADATLHTQVADYRPKYRMGLGGIIKSWGFGINTANVLYRTLDQIDPDICLLALQYSILDYQQALDKPFPLLDKRDISVVVGAPLNGGFLAGRNRFDNSSDIPQEMQDKYNKLIAESAPIPS
jgi:hypothetical protein